MQENQPHAQRAHPITPGKNSTATMNFLKGQGDQKQLASPEK
jgi:hypothetical protein